MTGARTPIELYWHSAHDTRSAFLLSQTGRRADAKWIPKSLADAPADTMLVKPHGEACERGMFHVEHFKLAELGWGDDEPDARQGGLFG
jgi:hypothetical protein